MLDAAGRSPMRTSHLHFIVTAPGHRRVGTHIVGLDGRVVAGQSSRVRFDIVLAPAE